MFYVPDPTQLEMPWETLEGVVKGISAIDMNNMPHKTLEEAEDFIRHYGYDCQNPDDRAELQKIQEEAISFIERRFLDSEVPWEELGEPKLDAPIPEIYKSNPDARILLLQASSGSGVEHRWACAILKVMHIISHINNAILYRYFEDAKNQILSRYYKAITHNAKGEILLGRLDEMHMTILGFETKDEKSRDSMILKLLCKRENVAEEVFDMIGVRLITHTAAEAIIALEILRRNKMLIFPNIIPSRSRNVLMDFDDFKVQYQEALENYRWSNSGLQETMKLIQQISADPVDDAFNPKNASSLGSYRSIHLTQRQLIRVKHPLTQEEVRFFFPYEIQLVDEANYIQNHSGSSAHALYKQNQLILARRRVLGPLFITLRKQMKREHHHLEPEPLP